MSVLNFQFRWDLGSGDIRHAQRLPAGDRVQVLIFTSLFTDARVSEDELPEGETDRHGAWSDRYHESRGAKLWTLRREKLSGQTLQLARGYALEALAWMVGTEVRALDVQVEAADGHKGKITVFYTELNGGQQQFTLPFSTEETE